MNRLKKEDYITEETKQLSEMVKVKLKEDREKALAQKLVDKIPNTRKQYVLDILSREIATK